jgi:hypothetical protein
MSRVARGAVAVLLGASLYLAYRAGGGADARATPPRPAPAQPVTETPEEKKGDEAYEVKIRLTEALGTARISTPSLKASQVFLATHWRKMKGPWTIPRGEASQLVWSLGLRTSAMELQWAVPMGAASPYGRASPRRSGRCPSERRASGSPTRGSGT